MYLQITRVSFLWVSCIWKSTVNVHRVTLQYYKKITFQKNKISVVCLCLDDYLNVILLEPAWWLYSPFFYPSTKKEVPMVFGDVTLWDFWFIFDVTLPLDAWQSVWLFGWPSIWLRLFVRLTFRINVYLNVCLFLTVSLTVSVWLCM